MTTRVDDQIIFVGRGVSRSDVERAVNSAGIIGQVSIFESEDEFPLSVALFFPNDFDRIVDHFKEMLPADISTMEELEAIYA
ncbi:MAG: hypothetical protein FWG15_02830 [Propionibacteriaceae bacterium]|nr:hypothetical protein [Propionibacteriaceae bacterium]